MDSQRKKEEIKALGSTGPALWFGIETWKIRRTDERKLFTFQYQCQIRWQQRIPLKRVGEIAEIVDLLKLRCLTKELEVVGTGP